jgi:hypothetical protein
MNAYIQKNTYEGIGIEISNGNGIRSLARRVGTYLNKKGFEVVRLTNANNFNHADTIIYYQDKHYQAAADLAEQIPGTQNIKAVTKLDRKNINIKILIGKDIVKHDGRVFLERS